MVFAYNYTINENIIGAPKVRIDFFDKRFFPNNAVVFFSVFLPI